MKNKIVLMLGILIFVVIMVVAVVLYEKLGSEADNGPMMVESSETVDAASNSSAIDAADSNAVSDSNTSADSDSGSSEPVAAPDFTVYDADGTPVKLSDFVGKPIVLNFWASWCGPCKNEMPDFAEAYETYGANVQFLMVNQTDGGYETVESATAFIEDAGYTFPVYYDTDLNAASVYGVSAIPMTFFIDVDGNLVAYAQGTLSASGLEKGISMIKE